MRTVSISVTDASRNFADCVNRARYQGTTFLLHKNGVAVARIGPVERNPKIENDLETDSSAAKAEERQPAVVAQDDGEPHALHAPEIW